MPAKTVEMVLVASFKMFFISFFFAFDLVLSFTTNALMVKPNILNFLANPNNYPASEGESLILRRAQKEDLRAACRLCVDVFFGEGALKNKEFETWGSIKDERKKCYESLCTGIGDINIAYFIVEAIASESSKSQHFLREKKPSKIIAFAELRITSEYCFILGEPFREFRPKISALSVDSTYRRRGVGTQLLVACLAQAHAWGHPELMLEVRDDNTDGVRFYTAAGFKEVKHVRPGLRIMGARDLGLYMRSTGIRQSSTPQQQQQEQQQQ